MCLWVCVCFGVARRFVCGWDLYRICIKCSLKDVSTKERKLSCKSYSTLDVCLRVVVVLKRKMKENKFTDASEKRRGKGRSKQSMKELYRIQNIVRQKVSSAAAALLNCV